MSFQKSQVAIILMIICSVSLVLKLYTVDFSIPVYSDDFGYALDAIAYKDEDFVQSTHKGSGWQLFVSFFYRFIESDDFIDYSNVIRVLSLSIATISVIAVYFLGRKFFDAKYSLVTASLFAFEPHLNYNSGFGLTEPLYHLVIITSFYFILNKNSKYVIPSLILAGCAWWIRINGLSVFIIITVIYFIIFRKSSKLFRNYVIGLALFLILVSPMLLQKYEQFGDPFYNSYNAIIFAGSYETLLDESTKNTSALQYIEKNGLSSFIDNFIFKGIYNIFWLLSRISFPYMFILIPFGIIFSFRAFDQNKQHIHSNWIFILLSLSFMIITLAIVPERRYLLYIFPFLIIFSVIPIQRVVEYGLSTFAFSQKQKNIFLLSCILIVILLSTYFTTVHFGKPDLILESEKREFAKFAVNNLHGKIQRDFGPAMDYIFYQIMTDSPGEFKKYKINSELKQYQELTDEGNVLETIFIDGKSVSEIVSKGEQLGLRYIISNEKSYFFHSFLDDIYANETHYPYLINVFDSEERGFSKLKLKVFEIDYKKFHQFKKSGFYLNSINLRYV